MVIIKTKMNITLLIPIVTFLVSSFVMYSLSKDPDKKKKPVKFILPSIIVSIVSFIALKYKDNMSPEPMMQGNYFD